MMFRRINISYGLIAVLVLLTLIQIISGSWSVISYLDYDRNLQQIAFQRERFSLSGTLLTVMNWPERSVIS